MNKPKKNGRGFGMTEKRFAVTQTVLGSGIYDFQAENELCESYDENAYSKVVKKLNELHEEKEQLKSDAIYWSQNAEARLKEIDKLRKEKEQLKDTLAFRSNQLALMETLIDDLGTDEMCREMEDILNG